MIAESLQSLEKNTSRIHLKRQTLLISGGTWVGELFPYPRGTFYLIYCHNHSNASAVMHTFQREAALQLTSAAMENKRMLTFFSGECV